MVPINFVFLQLKFPKSLRNSFSFEQLEVHWIPDAVNLSSNINKERRLDDELMIQINTKLFLYCLMIFDSALDNLLFCVAQLHKNNLI